jgi:valyl-tRNA synthetase
MTEIPKAYVPQSVEEKWYQFWLEKNCFTANPASRKPPYSIVIPPPNVTGVLTLGHVLNNTLQDILARKARMDGKEVLWLPGTDHAGIATQTAVERNLKKAGQIKHRDDLGREKFLEEVWKWKNEKGGIIIQQLKKLGASCDWSRERFTMDADYSRCVQKVFVDLYKKGLIYRGKRMVNWCPASLTALSDEEVVMKEQKGSLYYFNVEIAETPGTFLTIATTRPETIPGDTAVAVNPKDSRYAHLIGKHALRALPADAPRDERLIPIIGDDHVEFAFGTGVLKVTPAHDKADFEIGLRHKLGVIEVIDATGHMTEAAGVELKGMERFKARKAAAEKLKELGVLLKEEAHTNNVGFSERADVPIEPRLSEQWFLKYPSVEQARDCVAQDDYSSASNLREKKVRIVDATGKELIGKSIRELRKSALIFAREHRFLGIPFKNEDSGIKIRVGRQSLSHAFSNAGVANILAVAVLPDLIRTAIWISSELHEPRNPMVKRVHRFIAALSLAGELHSVVITAKEFFDGTVLYDHKAKKITFGGKSLEAHLSKEKLDTQPAPNAEVRLGLLLAGVKLEKMRFYPSRWAKVYDHWMGGIQDWCISRQLWWGHRIPVWYFLWNGPIATEASDSQNVRIELPYLSKEQNRQVAAQVVRSGNKSGEILIAIAVNPGHPEIEDLLVKNGGQQDPDVLDTWFSSWLWPFATMGWPEQTETLQKFYPTTDLVTGPDIIFFWVARMIMAGFEYMGELPFKNVYFTGIIRDKQGRKMSKSLGNSPDPLDLIAQYGADALRFGVIRSAPQGQDVLYDEQQVELGRNFCNKLWNACRFRQMQTGETEGEIRPELLTSDDRWILLKLNQAIAELTEALAAYKFNEAAQTLYRFFWSEFCDWYLETSKASLSVTTADSSAGAQRANTLAVIDFILSNTLRLFHPFMPFITEELWHGLGFQQDLPPDQGGETIMFAHWPKTFDADIREYYGLDEVVAKQVDARNEFITEGRNLRRAGGIQGNKKVKYIFKPAATVSPHDLAAIRQLLNAEPLEAVEDYVAPKGTPATHSELGDLFLPLEGVANVEVERERIQKEMVKAEAEIKKAEQKLANPAFVGKAPAAVLDEHRKRLVDGRSELERLGQALEALRG